MTLFQRLLLVPCLAPLLAAVVVAALNTGQPTALRVLTWRSARLPIGAWVAIAASGSALLTAVACLSTTATVQPLRRQVHRPMGWSSDNESWAEAPEDPDRHRRSDPPPSPQSSAWPERDVRDPAPTVAVPFRVIKRGKPAPTPRTSEVEQPSEPVASASPSNDDWGQPLADDW